MKVNYPADPFELLADHRLGTTDLEGVFIVNKIQLNNSVRVSAFTMKSKPTEIDHIPV
jgi:hypothetical protein